MNLTNKTVLKRLESYKDKLKPTYTLTLDYKPMTGSTKVCLSQHGSVVVCRVFIKDDDRADNLNKALAYATLKFVEVFLK